MGSSPRMAGEVGSTAPLCEAESPKKKKTHLSLVVFLFFYFIFNFFKFFIYFCMSDQLTSHPIPLNTLL